MSAEIEPRLDRIRARLDAMTERPEIKKSLWSRMVTPLLRLVGWQARFETNKIVLLLDAPGKEETKERLEDALDELEENVDKAERTCAVHGYAPTAHASWLYRCESVVRRVATLATSSDEAARRALEGLDRTRIIAPLRLVTPAEKENTAPSTDSTADNPTRDAHRIVELELAAIDHIIDAARSETRVLERRRRLLEGARRLLLDASAALPLDPTGVVERQKHVVREITKLDRLEAAGLSPTVAVAYQAKQALRRGDRDRLYAALVALDSFALSVGDADALTRTGAALAQFASDGADTTDDLGLARSAEQAFGADVVETIRAQYASARERHTEADADPELSRLALAYLAPGTEDAALSALLSVDGCFEVGTSLSPVRVREMHEVARLVSEPTGEMLLVQARDVSDISAAVVSDPRTILLDLAAGRLLARKYVRRDRRMRTRTRLIGEVRVYVLDGSTSMIEDGKDGARARVRDAVLLGELATLMRRLDDPTRDVRLSLFYRFFTKRLGDLRRVATPSEALAAMADVVGTARKGGTNIQSALVSSLELIRDKKKEDPDLARANVVLVTDGNAPVDPEVVRAAREDAGDVAISISVIALGEENPVLRDLVARQRARGERSFYHHVGDEELAALCRGEALGPRVHAPADVVLPERGELDALVLELEDLEPARAVQGGGQGAAALEEATARDRASLDRRYARWFPTASAPAAAASKKDDDDVMAARVVLATVAEVVGELGGDGLRRKADAIDLVERLLPDARLSPVRFAEVLARGALGAELGHVHRAVASAAESFEDRLGRSGRGRLRAP
ncbi:MAG: VWA domain-containing protein [Polyangiaceae bacterium]|nr:VWA domain-containing protein [Polyangiaceae bacterium]